MLMWEKFKMLEDAKTSFLSALHLYIQRAAHKVSNNLKSFLKRKRHAKMACLFFSSVLQKFNFLTECKIY